MLLTAAAAGAGNVDGEAEDLAKGDPKTDVDFPCCPMFDTTGADVDTSKGEKDVFAFAESRRVDKTSVEPEALGTEELELDPKVEVEFCPNAEELPPTLPAPNAELAPKLRFPKTFGVVLRFANAEAAAGTEVGAEVVASSDAAAGMEDNPKAETGAGTGDVPKTKVDELASSIADGEGLTPKLLVSHAVALGFSGWGWC